MNCALPRTARKTDVGTLCVVVVVGETKADASIIFFLRAAVC